MDTTNEFVRWTQFSMIDCEFILITSVCRAEIIGTTCQLQKPWSCVQVGVEKDIVKVNFVCY